MNIELRIINKNGVRISSMDCPFEMTEDACLIKPPRLLIVNEGETLELELLFEETPDETDNYITPTLFTG